MRGWRKVKISSGFVKIIDLFAGPGGLGEGFSSEITGKRPFRISVSVEADAFAHKTLLLRAFCRSFLHAGNIVPDEYYQYIAGQLEKGELLQQYPDEYEQAKEEAICATLGDIEDQPEIDRAIESSVGHEDFWLLIGGPPCQAYSLVGRSRMLGALKDNEGNLKNDGKKFYQDHRHKLYREYLRVIGMHNPAVFVMENVKGILSSKLKGERIFPTILNDLRRPSEAGIEELEQSARGHRYHIVSFVTGREPTSGNEVEYLIRSELFGVPQARHRVILLGIRDDVFDAINGIVNPLKKIEDKIFLKKAIGNLPRLRSGFSKSEDTEEHWKQYFETLEKAAWLDELDSELKSEIKDSIKTLKSVSLDREYSDWGRFPIDLHDGWFRDDNLKGLLNHNTRAHKDSDLARYLFVSAYGKVKGRSPRLKDFPEDLLPEHDNVIRENRDKTTQKFADRFKVQVWGEPSSTITSHISKDGHYFIHPDPTQCRSLTVREAARLQTFPDNYFFEGGRTQQYHQVGNAVPPYLAKQLAEVVWDIFKRLK
jgi:DNA (cytosine-5)-methyltransferase 1